MSCDQVQCLQIRGVPIRLCKLHLCQIAPCCFLLALFQFSFTLCCFPPCTTNASAFVCQVRGSVLEPCRIAVDMTLRNPGPVGDLNFFISDLRLNLSADILELVGSLQSSVLEPLVQPSPDQ